MLLQVGEKKKAKRLRRNTDFLLTPKGIARELVLPEPFIRRYAWERRLDAFPGPWKNNNIWLAAYAVVYLGYSSRDASVELGFSIGSIENFLHRAGWKRYIMWGRTDKKVLVQPRPFAIEKWSMVKRLPGYETTGVMDYAQYPYFQKKRR